LERIDREDASLIQNGRQRSAHDADWLGIVVDRSSLSEPRAAAIALVDDKIHLAIVVRHGHGQDRDIGAGVDLDVEAETLDDSWLRLQRQDARTRAAAACHIER